MADMYQVYSQQRPGRPRWALGSSAVLLLATVGLAAALIHHKTGGDNVVLQSFSIGPFHGKLPLGWTKIEEGVPENTLLALAEPAGQADSTAGDRRLFIFGRAVLTKAAPEQVAQAVARDYAMQLFPVSGELQEKVIQSDEPSSQIAGFPAVTLELKLVPREGSVVFCLVQTAMISRVQVMGVALVGVGEPQKADSHLLERISRSLELSAFRPSDRSAIDPFGLPSHQVLPTAGQPSERALDRLIAGLNPVE